MLAQLVLAVRVDPTFTGVRVCVWRERDRESARARASERESERERERERERAREREREERKRNLAKRIVRAKTHAHIGARADAPATLVPMWPL
jgi:hypothetical protein